MKRILLFIVLLFPMVAGAQAQDCTIKYLGVNAGKEEAGEPSVEADPYTMFGMSERVNATYQSTNVFRLYSQDTGRSVSGNNSVINVFEITCVTPE